jgi:hypothetical protein
MIIIVLLHHPSWVMSKNTIVLLDVININELVTQSTNKNIADLYRSINEFKKGYQPRTNLVKDMNGDALADSHGRTNSLSYLMCTGLIVLGRRIYIQLSH